jgi:short subunit dehydrogenase-like uncharacterized protein
MPASILIYGASGYMGSLTARAAVERGMRPVLAGRNAGRLTTLAAELGLEHRQCGLDDRNALDAALDDVSVVINAAGPFASTWEPIVDACIRRGVHYLDLTGEVLVFEGIRSRSADARRRGIVLLPGVGFDVVPSDCLAAYVAAQMPGADTLRIAISGLELVSRGSAQTLVNMAGRPVLVRRDGRLVTIPPGSLERTFDYGDGPSRSVAVTWGDLASAFNTTGIPNIETYFQATPAVRAMVGTERFLGPLMATPPWQATMQGLTRWLPGGPSPDERRAHGAVVVAEAAHRSGHMVRARLKTPEAYTLSARTAAEVARAVAAGDYEPGFQTPARLYGANYILGFEGVTRETLPS